MRKSTVVQLVMLLLASQMCKEKQMRYEDGRLPNTIPFLNLGPDC